MDDAIAHDKSTWRQFFYDTTLQHVDCPDACWKAWVHHWDSDEGREKSRNMQEKRALGISAPSQTLSANSEPLPPANSPQAPVNHLTVPDSVS